VTVFRSSWERLLGQTDSPIESFFLEAICSMAYEHGFTIAKRTAAREGVISVLPQAHVAEHYRADFLVSYHFFGSDYRVVVECDGHDFHERTKEQAKRDKRRDRDLQKLGYEVFRFTGSELRGNPRAAAYDVLDAIMAFQTGCIVDAMKQSSKVA
jgi:very-short-patch-repair endonuclease